MQVTYTNNNKIIFDVTGKDILKHIGKDISTLIALLVLSYAMKEIDVIEDVKAFKTIGGIECFDKAFKVLNSAIRL